MTFNYYVELFRPNTAFSFHFKPDDIALMQEMEETRKYFSAEYAVKNAKLVLDYVEGVGEDVDYAYIANFLRRHTDVHNAYRKNAAHQRSVHSGSLCCVPCAFRTEAKKVDMVECLKEERE